MAAKKPMNWMNKDIDPSKTRIMEDQLPIDLSERQLTFSLA
jgi:hypothetical protein